MKKMINKSLIKRTLNKSLYMIIGAILMSFSYNAFALPNGLLSGGVGGLSLMCQYNLGIPLYMGLFLFNLPIFLWGFKELDKKFMLYSVLGTITMIFAIPLLKPFIHVPKIDLILASICSGVLSGTGVGLFLRGGASSGGTDIIGTILKRKKNLSIGTVSFAFNILVIGISLFMFNFEIALYTLISIYISGKITDAVVDGFNKNKSVVIISENYQDISNKIMNDMGRGVTLLNGQGAFSGENKFVINCIVSNYEIAKVKEIIEDTDPKAFMFITDTIEVAGRGFGKNKI